MGNDRYDAIVVGAGPAGSAAALVMAQNNMSVLMLERGEYPGSKNMFGGTIYREPTEVLVPAFWEHAPLERPVVSDELWLMDTDSAVKIGFTGLKFGKPPYNKFTALRSKFDRWFADKAREAGARLVTNTLVKEIIYEKSTLFGKKASGVVLDSGDRIYCDVIILAEGVSGNLTEKAGLRGKITPDGLTLYVKQILELPSGIIEDRFNLEKGEGASLGMIGYPASGAIGKGGIFTNKDSLSIMVGAYLNQIIDKGLNPFLLLERFKSHPLVKRLIQGAKPVEYQAHTLPKGGYEQIPKLSAPGIMVTGDAALMVSGRRGTDLAMLTGRFAGETASQAKSAGNFSESTMAVYDKKIKTSFFMKDIKAGRGSKKYYEHHPDADFLLSKAANNTAYEYFTVDLVPYEMKLNKIIGEIKNLQAVPKTLSDIYYGYLHWGVF
ncbi:FAD-dependent oxidoreductase [Thermoanaerobacterium sp. DL9XJH110]|jgi:electron transfer flavoprotein-quinone oxidoreductase|uniref:FAD-dependent oxidoreductase n=1 Tax=Thermoanaerobacterium sp. DL9XJH110 TaxID=3386643 RepID=UPI003BB73E58